MPYLSKYHIREQSARPLLHPVLLTLRELEQRTTHYAARLNLDPGADATLTQAAAAIANARAEVERLMTAREGAR
jgi:hypothetical protein